jgi:hypothetical protein
MGVPVSAPWQQRWSPSSGERRCVAPFPLPRAKLTLRVHFAAAIAAHCDLAYSEALTAITDGPDSRPATGSEHLEKGHPELSATWQRIMTAIEKLQADKPEPGETVQ